MKRIILFALSTILVFAGCNRVDEKESDFTNHVYINEARVTNTEKVLLKPFDVTIDKTLEAAVALPANNDITVTYKVDASLVDQYNAIYGANAEMLPEQFYNIPHNSSTIYAGKVTSEDVHINFTALDEFPRGEKKTFVLPVTMASSTGVSILSSSNTIFYVVREGPPIVTAVNIKGTSLQLANPAQTTMKSMTKITMELLMRPQNWPVTDSGISTIMGVEGYYLWRIGDAGIDNNQIQLARAGTFGGNWTPNNGKLAKGVWQHVALTQDFTTGECKLYVDGLLKDKGTGGTGNISFSQTTSRIFYIGSSWDGGFRNFDGDICEVRIWNTIRTQSELQASMYQVDAATEGLQAYWKCNEHTANTLTDYTGNGNTLVLFPGKPDVTWIDVELGGEEEEQQ